MALTEGHINWKHLKALLLMELNVRLIENKNVSLGSENQCTGACNFNFQLKHSKGKC